MRTKVEVRYEKGVASLFNLETGSLYKNIKPGDRFYVDNMMKSFKAVLSGEFLKISHPTFLPEGRVLRPGRYLWAVTSGSARNGLWHILREPKNVLEETLAKFNQSFGLVKYTNNVDLEYAYGGNMCSRKEQQNWIDIESDGQIKDIPNRCDEECSSCYYQEYGGTKTVSDATIVIVYKKNTSLNGMVWTRLESVNLLPGYEAKAAEMIEEFLVDKNID